MPKLTADQQRILKYSNREQLETMLAAVLRRDSHDNCTAYQFNMDGKGYSSHFTTTSKRFYEVADLPLQNNLRGMPLPDKASEAVMPTGDRTKNPVSFDEESEFFHPNDD
jgi:hypothetical protein